MMPALFWFLLLSSLLHSLLKVLVSFRAKPSSKISIMALLVAGSSRSGDSLASANEEFCLLNYFN